MLVRFTVENCLSFRDRVELSMIAAEEVLDHPEHVIRAGDENGVPVLKLGVIYGANASGKSNLVKAILIARGLILNPPGPNERIARTPFKLDPACRDRPTRFEFEIKLDDRYFAYGFSVSSARVEEEWLFEVGRTVEVRIFERTGNNFEWGQLKFSSPDEQAFLEFTAKGTLPNRLFLSECRERNVRDNVPAAVDIINILQWFERGLSIALHDLTLHSSPSRVHSDAQLRKQLTDYLRCFDTGIEAIDIELMEPQPRLSEFKREMFEIGDEPEPPDNYVWEHDPYKFWARDEQGSLKAWRLVMRHRGRNGAGQVATFDMSEESDGTRRLMNLVPAMITMMSYDGVCVIDELDRSLHPEILHSFLAITPRAAAASSSSPLMTRPC
jgi:AAA15 family ATPase/GTPase